MVFTQINQNAGEVVNPPLRWSSTPPTETGWYQVKSGGVSKMMFFESVYGSATVFTQYGQCGLAWDKFAVHNSGAEWCPILLPQE